MRNPVLEFLDDEQKVVKFPDQSVPQEHQPLWPAPIVWTAPYQGTTVPPLSSVTTAIPLTPLAPHTLTPPPESHQTRQDEQQSLWDAFLVQQAAAEVRRASASSERVKAIDEVGIWNRDPQIVVHLALPYDRELQPEDLRRIRLNLDALAMALGEA